MAVTNKLLEQEIQPLKLDKNISKAVRSLDYVGNNQILVVELKVIREGLIRVSVALMAEDESLLQQQAIPLYRGFPSG